MLKTVKSVVNENVHVIQLIRTVVYVYLCAAERVVFMKKFWIGPGPQNFHICTPLKFCCAPVKNELGSKSSCFGNLCADGSKRAIGL